MKVWGQLPFMIRMLYKIGAFILLLCFLWQCSHTLHEKNTLYFKVFAEKDTIIYNNGFSDYLITQYESGKVAYYKTLKETKKDSLKKHILVPSDNENQIEYAILYSLESKGHNKVNLKIMIKKKGRDNLYTIPFMNLGKFSYQYESKEDLKKWLHDYLAKATYKCCLTLKPKQLN